jgi:GT2 family glycosyltransferase
MVKASIIVLNYNGKRFLNDCLSSIYKQSYKDFEIIFVDNASKDDSIEFLKRNFPKTRIVINKENLGFAEGNNVGVREAKGDYIILLNNDTIVEKDWLKELVTSIEKDKSIGVAVSKGAYSESDLKFYKTITLLGYNIKLPKDFALHKNDIFFASGCSLIYKRELLDKPFDKDYFAYFEDLYLSWLLRLKGYNVKIADTSKLNHIGQGTSKDMGIFLKYLGEKNRIMNMFLFYSFSNLVKILPLFFTGLLIHNIYDLKGLLPRAKAYLWCLFNLFKILNKRHIIQKQRKVKDKEVIKYMSCKLYGEEEWQVKGISRILLRTTNKLIYNYCQLVNIKTIEFSKK